MMQIQRCCFCQPCRVAKIESESPLIEKQYFIDFLLLLKSFEQNLDFLENSLLNISFSLLRKCWLRNCLVKFTCKQFTILLTQNLFAFYFEDSKCFVKLEIVQNQYTFVISMTRRKQRYMRWLPPASGRPIRPTKQRLCASSRNFVYQFPERQPGLHKHLRRRALQEQLTAFSH